jgi:hypothetical protein
MRCNRFGKRLRLVDQSLAGGTGAPVFPVPCHPHSLAGQARFLGHSAGELPKGVTPLKKEKAIKTGQRSAEKTTEYCRAHCGTASANGASNH